MGTRRNDLVSDLQNTKQALRASEKRAKRATRRVRDLEKVLAQVMPRMEFWADSTLPDEQNAFKVMTVGQCRAVVAAMRTDEADDAEEPVEAEAAA